MNILTVEKASKGYGEKILFSDITLGIHTGDKIGLIGINGTGKTTLLKIIAGIVDPDEGTVTKGNGVSIAYLPQNPEFPDGIGIIDYVLEGKVSKSEEWGIESEAKTILTKLGIVDFHQKIEHLSGGQKKRVALARTLVAPADVLVLDEPTNHIDNDMALWLERYLDKYNGVLVMITHDRYFLDRVTNKIIEIDQGKLYSYQANYSGYLKLKAEREDMELATERKRQAILKTELEWMMRGARARSTKQKARIERFESLKNEDGPKLDQVVQMESVGRRLGKKTVELDGIYKAYGDNILIADYNYIFLRTDRIGIIGPNGCGKSTLLKIITRQTRPDQGTVTVGETIKIGYYAQECEAMDADLRVIDYIREIAEYIKTPTGTISATQMLERFLFTSAMQYTKVNMLSGGERRRLYLLKVLMEEPNVLILDEPTNDLDITTLTILEDYLDQFQGIVITVSHDRYFLDRVVDRIFSFEGNGRIRQYEGGFTDYMDTVLAEEKVENVREKDSKSKQWKSKDTKIKFTYMEQREFEVIDDEIAALETQLDTMDESMAQYASQYTKLNEIMEQKDKIQTQLDEKMERWIYLNDKAEQMKQQNLVD